MFSHHGIGIHPQYCAATTGEGDHHGIGGALERALAEVVAQVAGVADGGSKFTLPAHHAAASIAVRRSVNAFVGRPGAWPRRAHNWA